jgi:hypothetical protein
MDRRQKLHPLQDTTRSVLVNSNCRRLFVGFGDASVPLNSPVWQLACNDHNWVLWNCESIPTLVILRFMAVISGKINSLLEHSASVRRVVSSCLQSYSAPNIPRVIRLTSGMRVKGKQKVTLSLSTPWRHKWGRSTAISILSLGTRWRWLVNITSRPLYPWKERPRYALKRGLAEPRSRSERFGGKKNLLLQPAFECCIVDPVC